MEVSAHLILFCCKRGSCRNGLMCYVEREEPKLTFDWTAGSKMHVCSHGQVIKNTATN